MTRLVINPYWYIPKTIAVEDLLPKQRRNPKYFSERGIRVFSNWGSNVKELNPAKINWSKVSSKDFPYSLRQDPGPHNSLGHLKFVFPNKFGIYLHDTPTRKLFYREVRTFSSGCIRIEYPVQLAAYILSGTGDGDWTAERIWREIQSGATKTVVLPKPIPIYLVYWTVWVESDGTIYFHEDVYNRNRNLDSEIG